MAPYKTGRKEGGKDMRKLLGLVIAAAVLWGGWWFVGSRGLEQAFSTWFEARRAEGWQAEYSDLKVAGFPNRFDTTFNDLRLADPDTGLAWEAPFFQILALSYKPHHVIAAWPDTQLIATPREKITVTADKMLGSIVFKPGTALELDRSAIELKEFKLTSDKGWWVLFPVANFATRTVPMRENAHEVSFLSNKMRPSADLVETLEVAGLPEEFQALHLDAELVFDAPWDRMAIEAARPQLTALNLSMLEAEWGDLQLQAAGKLTVDGMGVPSGKITIRATNWRDMLHIAVATGALPQGVADTLESGLAALAGLSGNPKTLDVPLTFRDARISLGPIPLGPAPLLVIR